MTAGEEGLTKEHAEAIREVINLTASTAQYHLALAAAEFIEREPGESIQPVDPAAAAKAAYLEGLAYGYCLLARELEAIFRREPLAHGTEPRACVQCAQWAEQEFRRLQLTLASGGYG